MKQLHERIVFNPILIEVLTTIKQRCAMERFIFLTEKKNGRTRAIICANRSTQCEYTKRNEAASLTAMTEFCLITAVINAEQGCDIMTANISNALCRQTLKRNRVAKESS
jgi:hypothetical protein